MNFLKPISFVFALFLVGCGEATVSQEEYDSMVSEKDSRIEELESEVLSLQVHIESLESKTRDVNAQFERFESENWRDVVPDAESSLSELNTEVESYDEYTTH